MFPKRFWIAIGSGQNLNEHIYRWRNSIFDNTVMTDLRTRAQFDAIGKMVDVNELRIYTSWFHKPDVAQCKPESVDPH